MLLSDWSEGVIGVLEPHKLPRDVPAMGQNCQELLMFTSIIRMRRKYLNVCNRDLVKDMGCLVFLETILCVCVCVQESTFKEQVEGLIEEDEGDETKEIAQTTEDSKDAAVGPTAQPEKKTERQRKREKAERIKVTKEEKTTVFKELSVYHPALNPASSLHPCNRS